MGNFLCLHQQDHQEEHQQEHQQDSTNLDSHIPAALCSSPPDGIDVNIFSYQEMSDATGSWDNGKIIGRGGFGCVYKGVLRPVYHNDIQVAIKKNHTILNGDMEWLREIKILGKFRHPNLVKLIGYCCEDDYRILVYEYMENGSLDNFLFRDQANVLSWPRRMKIALHAARGLAFLHGQERPIICRDFKPANILLDKDFHAKIADLGSAIEEPEQSDMYTRPAGTVGYIAPEYAAVLATCCSNCCLGAE